MPGILSHGRRSLSAALLAVCAVGAGVYWAVRTRAADAPRPQQAVVGRYCLECHNDNDLSGNLSFEHVELAQAGQSPDTWEKVIRKLRVGMMPPADALQPTVEERGELIAFLERRLDRAAVATPDPGPSMIRRLNRAEYENAIRDLLAVEVDATALLPPDDSAYGFDNIADALGTSPVHVEQYLSAAGKVAALAVGDPETGPAAQTFRIRQDASQDVPVVGMPLGTVGGGAVRVVLPLDGDYKLNVSFFKSNLGAMKGLELPHEVELAVDGERVHVATIGGPEDFAALMRNITEAALDVDRRSSATVPLTAGAHEISVGFVYGGALQGSVRLQAFDRSSQDLLDATGHPHIESLDRHRPVQRDGSGQHARRARRSSLAIRRLPTPTRPRAPRRVRARRDHVATLARQAYRGTDTEEDLTELMSFYDTAVERRGFEGGVQTAIERLLVEPEVLVPHRARPARCGARARVYALADIELASRLSFFLWSSVPDDELLDARARG